MRRKQQLQTGLLKKHAGFTLLEMLVVMVIIGLLAGLVGPRIFGKVDSSKVQTAQTQIKMLESALNIMRLDVGQTPPQDQGLQWLLAAPQDPSLQSLWKGPYIEGSVPADPWGILINTKRRVLITRRFQSIRLVPMVKPVVRA
jgi:general secretion pathway protein G